MNKLLNVILQLALVLAFSGVAFVMQDRVGGNSFSDGALGVLILCVPLCWVVIRFFGSLVFYLTLILLGLGFVGGYFSLGMVDASLTGYVIVLFAMFLFLGAGMVCVSDKMALFFLRSLRMPLAGWVLVVLLVDFALELFFFQQEIGLILLQIKVSALLAGLILGLIARMAYAASIKQDGEGLGQRCLVGPIGGGHSAAVATTRVAPAVNTARRTPKARPPVEASPVRPAPAVARSSGSVSKTSVLDAKLEALCSGNTKKKVKERPQREASSKSEDAGSTPSTSEENSEPVEKVTETGKIVSSVDFG